MLIGAIVSAVVIVVFGAGTAFYLAFGRSEGKGLNSPQQTVDRFLTAVYKTHSVSAAERLVCASARDTKALRKRITNLNAFDRRYKSPSYSWPEPTVESRTKESATVTVSIKLTTSDDKISEHKLRILTIRDNGWLVCEINKTS